MTRLPLNCRVSHGANDSYFEIVGKSAASVRRALRTPFNIPDDAEALVNSVQVDLRYPLRPGDHLEFVKRWGCKGALEPEEWALIQEIRSDLKATRETLNRSPYKKGLLRLRLNSTEKAIFKALFQRETLKGEALAKQLQYTFDSNFKGTLAALVRHGLLANSDDGYFVPPAVREFLTDAF